MFTGGQPVDGEIGLADRSHRMGIKIADVHGFPVKDKVGRIQTGRVFQQNPPGLDIVYLQYPR